MTNRLCTLCILTFFLVWNILAVNVFAWTDQAHMAMGKAAGFSRFQNCPAADISHTVATINNLTQTDEQRIMTRDEALQQVTDAASLGKAIMCYCGK